MSTSPVRIRGRRIQPFTQAEREAIRERMTGNTFGAGKTMSAENRQAHSERMTAANPSQIPGVAQRAADTKRKKYGPDFYSRMFKKIWAARKKAGAVVGRKVSKAERTAASQRMKANNPMRRPEVVARVKSRYTSAERRRLSERMKQTWRDGRITPNMFLGKRKERGANKTERMLFPFVRRHKGRFVGDGTFWIKNTASGICRNPDFIFGSGKNKVALLVHGAYWHRDKAAAEKELADYTQAGWRVFVLWTKRLSPWMMDAVKAEVRLWLAAIKSSPLKTPAVRQFMTWNVCRTTTS